MSEENRKKRCAENYYEKIFQKNNRTIVAINYVGAKDDVDAICVVCSHKWKIRADHLVDRCWCPRCKKVHLFNDEPPTTKMNPLKGKIRSSMSQKTYYVFTTTQVILMSRYANIRQKV